MYIHKLSFSIDWKRKTMHVYLDNDEAQKIEIDNEGSGVLLVEMFKSMQIGSLKKFFGELKTLVSHEQFITILSMWGNSLAIKVGVLSNLLQDRDLARAVINLGSQKGIIVMGYNSIWKVANKEEQKTMKEYADRLKRGTMHREIPIEQLDAMGGGEEGINQEGINQVEESSNEEKTIAEPIKETTIQENIASGKVTIKSAKELQAELKVLQEKLNKDTGWNEEETPHTVVSKINTLKAQLRRMGLQASSPVSSKQSHVKSPIPKNLPARKVKP